MADKQRITSVKFSRYKAFQEFSVALDEFNILVGPNNSGKSTILGAFRILAEALRRAKSKSPVLVQGPGGTTRGHDVNLDNVPIATENVFYNYRDDEPAQVSFRLSGGDHLTLYFPERGACNLTWDAGGRAIASPSAFRQHFSVDVGLVPILGPVEHNEPLYQKEAAREALLTHRASRNFRNIWYHYPDSFDEFRALVQETWPGMDIKKPEVDVSYAAKPLLHMFCPEERLDREIFWAGFGFQVWCQMLTFMVMHKDASLFVIDEPDIYLHSDLQRQLIAALRELGPDILLATHSTEIISEADPNQILVVTKNARSAKRVGDPSQLQSIFSTLGSNLNPTLTQLARCRKVVYVEGKDFQVLQRFAARLGFQRVARRSEFAVVPTHGFNPARAKMFTDGVEATLAASVSVALVFDRDYRSDEEVAEELANFDSFCQYAHIHSKKELENFLLVPEALGRAVRQRVAEQNRRVGGNAAFSEDMRERLGEITDGMKHAVQAQYLGRRRPHAKAQDAAVDDTTITSELLAEFDDSWADLDTRLDMVPGREVLARLNAHIQDKCGVTVTPSMIIGAMTEAEIPDEMKDVIAALDAFAKRNR
ncbi:MAG: ATP-binding protein [Actinobacteria bacterium]|nr:MAG: ATP-binding protein [Actinomycetota bacterium]